MNEFFHYVLPILENKSCPQRYIRVVGRPEHDSDVKHDFAVVDDQEPDASLLF